MATKKMTFEVEVEDKASADFRKLERTIKDALEAAYKAGAERGTSLTKARKTDIACS